MRKIVFMFIALIAMSQNVCAQGMTATLQSEDNLSVFYGIDAFKDAYEEAKDGDQITLSAGTFNTPDGSVTKSLRITGIGAYEESANTVFASLTAAGKNIRIEGVKFTNTLYVSGSKDLIVTRCWVEKLNASSNYTNALFDQCVHKEIKGMPYAIDFTFKNCTINDFSDENATSNIGRIFNSVIYYFISWNEESHKRPYAIYKNCILGSEGLIGPQAIVCNAPSEFYNNVGFSINYSTSFNFGVGCVNSGNQVLSYTDLFNKTMSYPAKPQNAPTGDDGTPVGPYGGTGFSQYPAIPRVVSKAIDGKTDDEGKINVEIKMKVEN